MIQQAELPDIQQILDGSPPLFWIVCLRNMPVGEEKDRVEAILFTRHGEPREVNEDRIRQELSEESARNSAFATSICRQYQILQRISVGSEQV